MHYILVNGKPTAEPDAQKWAAWFESAEAERVVEQTQVESLMISTVFIGLDLRLLNHGRPLVYETMIFGAEGIQTLAELGRRPEAERAHRKALPSLAPLDDILGAEDADRLGRLACCLRVAEQLERGREIAGARKQEWG